MPHANPTTNQVYARAQELGLELCPAEVGPHMRLAIKDQLIEDYYWIGMKQITDSDGYPGAFCLVRDEGGHWLNGSWADPDGEWDPEDAFVFCLRPPAKDAGKKA